MDTDWLQGHRIPVINRGHFGGNKNENRDFARSNEELEGDLGTLEEKGGEDIPIRKSELVEIPTETARIIYKTSGIFPFDFIPDELIVDEIKVSVVYNHLISKQINNILIKDITDIIYNSTLFFGSLQITGGEYQGPEEVGEGGKGPLIINNLWSNDAHTARRVIMGLMIFSDRKVDTSQMTVEQISQKAYELGVD